MRLRLLALLLSLTVLPSFAQAGQVVEQATGYPYQTPVVENGINYTLVGVGLRRKWFVKVYTVGMYVETDAARRDFPALVARTGGSDQAHVVKDQRAEQFVIWGRFNKLAIMHFVRDVSAKKIRESFEDAYENDLSATAPPDVRRDTQTLLALFDRDMKSGENIVMRTSPDGQIGVELANVIKKGPRNPRVARDLWEIYLGRNAIQSSLREGLVSRITVLGH